MNIRNWFTAIVTNLFLFPLFIGGCVASLDPGEDEVSSASSTCQPMTILVVEHEENGSQKISQFQLLKEVIADPILALRAFEKAANFVGKQNIQAIEVQTWITCPKESGGGYGHAQITSSLSRIPTVCRRIDKDLNVVLCENTNGHQVPNPSPCSETDLGSILSLDCGDSKALILKEEGKVIIENVSDSVHSDIAARQNVLRQMLANMATLANANFNFDVQLDESMYAMSKVDYQRIVTEIERAVANSQPLPKLGNLLDMIPEPPLPQSFYDKLSEAFNQTALKLETLANITNTAVLSPQQIDEFYNRFVKRAEILDDKLIEATPNSIDYVRKDVSQSIDSLINLSPFSPSYKQQKAAYEALLKTYSEDGVFTNGQQLDYPLDLQTSLTAQDFEERLFAADVRNQLSEAIKYIPDLPEAVHTVPLSAWADKAYAVGQIEQGYRLLERTETYLDYVQGNTRQIELSQGAHTQYGITTDSGTFIGYEVTMTANYLAEYDLDSDTLTIDYYAYARIQLHSALGTEDVYQQMYYIEQASEMMDLADGYSRGIPEPTGRIRGMWSRLMHPEDVLSPRGSDNWISITEANQGSFLAREYTLDPSVEDRQERFAILDVADMAIELADKSYDTSDQESGDSLVEAAKAVIGMVWEQFKEGVCVGSTFLAGMIEGAAGVPSIPLEGYERTYYYGQAFGAIVGAYADASALLAGIGTGAVGVGTTISSGGLSGAAGLVVVKGSAELIAVGAAGTVFHYYQFQKALDKLASSNPGGSSRKLADNLIESGVNRPDLTAAHHIVPWKHPLAKKAREILERFNIDIDGAFNGVFLPDTKNSLAQGIYHRSLHRTSYIDFVTDKLKQAKSRDHAIEILEDIRDSLLSLPFDSNRFPLAKGDAAWFDMF